MALTALAHYQPFTPGIYNIVSCSFWIRSNRLFLILSHVVCMCFVCDTSVCVSQCVFQSTNSRTNLLVKQYNAKLPVIQWLDLVKKALSCGVSRLGVPLSVKIALQNQAFPSCDRMLLCRAPKCSK